jgi:hypothetical protein
MSLTDLELLFFPPKALFAKKPVLVLVQVWFQFWFQNKVQFYTQFQNSSSRTESKLQTISGSDFPNQTKTSDSNLPNQVIITQNWLQLRIINSNSC